MVSAGAFVHRKIAKRCIMRIIYFEDISTRGEFWEDAGNFKIICGKLEQDPTVTLHSSVIFDTHTQHPKLDLTHYVFIKVIFV